MCVYFCVVAVNDNYDVVGIKGKRAQQLANDKEVPLSSESDNSEYSIFLSKSTFANSNQVHYKLVNHVT